MVITIRKMALYFLMLCTVILMAACTREAEINNGNKPGNAETPVQEDLQQKIASKSVEIVSINGNSVLVTAYIDKGKDSYIDAYSLSITEKSELLHSDGTAATNRELVVGAQVEAWYDGDLMETFPSRAHAAKLILIADEQEQLSINRSEAVRIALEAQTELTGPWAVRIAEKDAANEFWNVELVYFQQIDQPVSVRINGKSGEITPAIHSENDAFRVYTPVPNEELGNEFVVEGEARVFEGAFSWSLEDGHQILAMGEALTDAGAPEWGKFKINVKFDHAVQPQMVLVLYEKSAKDGTGLHTLALRLNVQKEHIKAREVE